MEHRWLYAWALASIAFGGASLIVPLYIIELGGDAFVLGVLFAASSFVGIPGALVFGRLADRTGRRRVFVLVAMGLSGLMLIVIPFVETIAAVIFGYAAVWLGFAAAVPVLTLLAIVGAPESEWTHRIALLGKMQGIGWTIGLLLGFALIGILSIFLETILAQRVFLIVCALSSLAGLGLAIRTLPADPAPAEVPSPRRIRRSRQLAGEFNVRLSSFPFAPTSIDVRQFHPRRFVDRFTPQLAMYYLAVLLAFTGFGAFFAPLPIYLGEVGFGSTEIFALYFALNLAAVVFFARSARLTGRFDISTVQVAGLCLRAVAFIAVAAAGLYLGAGPLGLSTAAVLFAVIGLTWAVIAVTAAALITHLSPPVIRGEALGMYNALVAMAGGIGGLLGGWLGALSYPLAFLLASGLIVVAGGVVLLIRRMQRRGRRPVAEASAERSTCLDEHPDGEIDT